MGEVNLLMLFNILVKRLWVIILGFVVVAVATFAYCEYLVVPRYQTTASIIVTNGAITTENKLGVQSSVSSTDISASLSLSKTVIDILSTPDVYHQTEEKLKGNKELTKSYSYSDLMGMASIYKNDDNSLFISVSFTGSVPNDIMIIDNEFIVIACNYLVNYIPNSSATVACQAVNASMIYPQTTTYTIVAGFIAAAIIFGLFVLAETLNKVIKSEEEVRTKYNLPILGAVPDFDEAGGGSYKSGYGKYGKYGYSKYGRYGYGYGSRYGYGYSYGRKPSKPAPKTENATGKEGNK